MPGTVLTAGPEGALKVMTLIWGREDISNWVHGRYVKIGGRKALAAKGARKPSYQKGG